METLNIASAICSIISLGLAIIAFRKVKTIESNIRITGDRNIVSQRDTNIRDS